MTDNTAHYNAYAARDPRFDGVFFIGVTSTKIYCRPICPAKTPKQSNCRFFDSPAAAEEAAFRPCLRCRPELAPGSAPIDDAHRIAHLMGQHMDETLIDDVISVEEIAGQFELSSRQLRRILRKELGLSPSAMLQTRRLLLAKQLLTDTELPITEVAYASGFASLRRFNDVFKKQYKMPPSHLRKVAGSYAPQLASANTSTVQLIYRPPYDWQGILDFLRARMLKGAEWITQDSYSRTVKLGKHTGWVAVKHAPDKRALMVEFTHSLIPVLPALLGRLRNLFDLSARPDLINAHLSQDKMLKKLITQNPGQSVTGAFDGFELAVRAILGQQVTVKAATTLACRFVEAFGQNIQTPFPHLNRLAPLAGRLANTTIDDVAKLGIVSARANSIILLAQACEDDTLQLNAGVLPDHLINKLSMIPGIGPWTAHYTAMRALCWPDAFPKEDIAVRNNLGGVTAKQAEKLAQAWSPWRSYAVFHIWRNSVRD